MALTVRGVGVVWGAGNLVCTGITIETISKIQSYDFTRQADAVSIRESQGSTVGRVIYDPNRVINISVIPSGATLSAAKTNMHLLLPAPGSHVVLTDSDGTNTPLEAQTAGNTTGNYEVITSKVGRSNTGVGTVDLALQIWDDFDAVGTAAIAAS